MTKTFTVVYRTGGYLNAKWRRCVPVRSMEEAQAQKADIERGGRKAIIKPTAEWDSIGLPVGFCGKCDPLTGECRHGMAECRAA